MAFKISQRLPIAQDYGDRQFCLCFMIQIKLSSLQNETFQSNSGEITAYSLECFHFVNHASNFVKSQSDKVGFRL